MSEGVQSEMAEHPDQNQADNVEPPQSTESLEAPTVEHEDPTPKKKVLGKNLIF